MASILEPEKIARPPRDGVLVAAILLLLGLGLAMHFSASYFRSSVIFGEPLQAFLSQLAYAGVGFGLMLVLALVPIWRSRKAMPVLFLLSLVFLALPYVPGIGAEYLGGRRWIHIGNYSFQPAEIVKLSLVLVLANFFANQQDAKTSPRFGTIMPPLLLVFLPATMIFFQNDFSTAVYILVLGLSMFFAAGVKLRYFVLLLVLMVPVAALAVYSKEHRIERILSYLNLEGDPMGSGYQVLASLSALQKGGLTGVGMGQGVKKLGTLPEAQSDFIFAVLGEELGYLGIILVTALFGVLVWRSYRYCLLETDVFRRLAVFGMASALALQAALNMGVVCSLVPATGITLPFFSSGGSSMLTTLAMCGVLVGMVRRLPSSKGGTADE